MTNKIFKEILESMIENCNTYDEVRVFIKGAKVGKSIETQALLFSVLLEFDKFFQ